MRKPIAKLIGLMLFLATFFPVPALPSEEVPLLPLLHYDKLESYGKLQMVVPAGYFEIGRRYVHAPRVEWQPIGGAVGNTLFRGGNPGPTGCPHGLVARGALRDVHPLGHVCHRRHGNQLVA